MRCLRAGGGAEAGGVLAGRGAEQPAVLAVELGAPMHGALRAMLQFAGTTVDGEASAVYPPLVESSVRY